MPRTAVLTENVNEVDIEEIVKIQEQIQIFVPPLGLFWLKVMGALHFGPASVF